MKPETILATLDHFLDAGSGALVPPIQTSSTYARHPDNSLMVDGRVYGRDNNPTYEVVEGILAKLEGGVKAQLLASGQAAGLLAVQALKPGDHVIIGQHMYWALRSQIQRFAAQWGLALSLVDLRDLDQVTAAIKPNTKLLMAEVPANPMLYMCDLPALADIVKPKGITLAVDATAATPILLQPIKLGADLVFHSTTKSLNGHSDILGGAMIYADSDHPLSQAMMTLRASLGAVPSAFDAWLLARGMRTAALRVKHASASALALGQAMQNHSAISHVLYPGLESCSGHAIAKRDMTGGFGCLMSFRLKGGASSALRFMSGLKLIARATSLGGTESLAEYRAPIEGAESPVPDDLIRLSIGIEHLEDLNEDIMAALESCL